MNNDGQCPFCWPNPATSVRFEKGGYSIRQCHGCELLFVHPQPTRQELMEIYDADYFKRGSKYEADDTGRYMGANRRNDLDKLSILARHVNVGRLLDVGCARGGFLQVAREGGFEVTGVAVSEAGVTHACQALGLDVVNCDLPAENLPADHFDVVTAWDVLEHLDDPHATLAEVNRVLCSGGCFVATTGDAGSLWAPMLGRYWQLLTPPQHLFFYHEGNIRKAFEAHGLRVKEVLRPGKYATLDFVLFKAGETLGPVMKPARAFCKALRLSNMQLYINLRDIMVCVAEKV